MELTFEELEQPTQNNNYWSGQNNAIPNKAKVSYGDILSSLNLVVENGVLKHIQVKPNLNDQNTQLQRHTQQQSNNVDPQMKNSYIFNKFFKDYKDQTIVEEPKPNLTREEQKQAMIVDYIKRVNERKRIEQIKSKKLIFNTNNINIAYKQNPISSNQLFRFSR
jgi:hypothetical protein